MKQSRDNIYQKGNDYAQCGWHKNKKPEPVPPAEDKFLIAVDNSEFVGLIIDDQERPFIVKEEGDK